MADMQADLNAAAGANSMVTIHMANRMTYEGIIRDAGAGQDTITLQQRTVNSPLGAQPFSHNRADGAIYKLLKAHIVSYGGTP